MSDLSERYKSFMANAAVLNEVCTQPGTISVPKAGETWLLNLTDGDVTRVTLVSLRFERQDVEVWDAVTEDPHGKLPARNVVTTIPTVGRV
jgi:hypothetical protein